MNMSYTYVALMNNLSFHLPTTYPLCVIRLLTVLNICCKILIIVYLSAVSSAFSLVQPLAQPLVQSWLTQLEF